MSLHHHLTRIIGPEIAALPVFSGRTYRHRLYDRYAYTDLTREKLCETGALWLIDRIFALQEALRELVYGKTQLWDLKTLPDGYLTITCRDKKTGAVLYYDHGYPEHRLSCDLAFVLQRNILQVRSA